jgi:hypothetical protein
MPRGLPPAVAGLLGVGQVGYGTLIGDERIRADGLFRLKRQLPIHTVPGYVTLKKVSKVAKGDLPIKSIFFPVSEKEYKEQMKTWLD